MSTSDPEPASGDGRPEEHVVRGMIAALAAFFMFTVMNVFAKLLSENHSVIEIAFYRNLIASLPFLFMVFVLGRREILVIRSKPSLVGLRAVLGAGSLVTTFAAFSLMPMAETTVLLFTASLFIPVLGVFFLGERVGPWRWSAVVIGFAGVVVMAGPAGQANMLGVAVALTAAFMHATLQIILRYLGRFESPETVTFYFMVIGTLVMALPLPFVAVTPTLAEVPLLFGVGLSGALAQWLLSTAFRNAPAAIVTVFNYSGIVWATLFGWLIWNDWPLPSVLAGAAIVIASNALIIWRESRRRALTGARVRAKF
ncbi:DMT family transporter [Wenzhouxiangella sp. XN24]|uniref:DMT family transporter n=1 Tax=Wenzhouxiangella sp. XN24 TaxID=2713569 RepID=UPI0013E9A233|nr:DMT family transporter [Wenzhouxiangella sp. XN24]NGX17676.1 DMT family transporter [Wenzhouxiangella sp. XN24]